MSQTATESLGKRAARSDEGIGELSEAFIRFGNLSHAGSPLYGYLSQCVARDWPLLEIAARAPVGQPAANLFFASVQRLLFDARDDPFASYYPNLAANASSWRESFRPFKKFCLANEEALTRSLRSRRVQTNEVNRCCFLYPLFSWAQEKWGGRPLALIELGASAGLNLALDQYRYEVPEVGRFGHEGSTVTLRSGFHGFDKNRYKLRPLDIEKRIGIDLAPLDLGCEEDKTWLEALVWPEQSERRENLKRAIPIARSSGVKVLKGDAAELLAQATAEVGLGTTLVVFHTCVANQMSGARKKALAEALESVSKRRDLFYLHNNIRDGICLDWSKGARWKRSVAGKADTHGRWVDWGWRE